MFEQAECFEVAPKLQVHLWGACADMINIDQNRFPPRVVIVVSADVLKNVVRGNGAAPGRAPSRRRRRRLRSAYTVGSTVATPFSLNYSLQLLFIPLPMPI